MFFYVVPRDCLCRVSQDLLFRLAIISTEYYQKIASLETLRPQRPHLNRDKPDNSDNETP
jgi:hypothetical protein